MALVLVHLIYSVTVYVSLVVCMFVRDLEVQAVRLLQFVVCVETCKDVGVDGQRRINGFHSA